MTAPSLPPTDDWVPRLLASTPDFAFIFATTEGVIREWLGAAPRVLGYTREEAIGRSMSMLFLDEDRARGLDVQERNLALAQGRSEDDRWHVRKDGSRFWASGVLSAVPGDDGAPIGLCKVLRDKTDLRTQVLALENRIAARDTALASVRNFLTTTAHELRNPLMPIASALTLLRRPDAAEFAERALAIMEKQTAVLTTLIGDLADAGQGGVEPALQLAFERVNLTAATRAACDGLDADARAKGLVFGAVLPPTDIWVRADPPRLQQMLLNLIANAIKYTPGGGHVSVSASIEGAMAIVRVEDDGVGIAPEVLPHIFELFTREARQPEIHGHGVGLAVVQQLAALHGGTVEARSPGPGLGSQFGLRLPLHESDPQHGVEEAGPTSP